LTPGVAFPGCMQVADQLALFGQYLDILAESQKSGPSSMACSPACRQRSKAVGVGGAGTRAWVSAMSIMAGSWFGAELGCLHWQGCVGYRSGKVRLPGEEVLTRSTHIYICSETPNCGSSSTACQTTVSSLKPHQLQTLFTCTLYHSIHDSTLPTTVHHVETQL